MTLTNQQRSDRCGKSLTAYSDDEPYTNLVDWLADAMHWCHCNAHGIAEALDSALMHFDAEISEAAQSGGHHEWAIIIADSGAAAAVAEPVKGARPTMKRPPYIDGPPLTEDGKVIVQTDPQAKNWGDPYKALVTTADFEMGENRRFKQRVFTFREKPSDEVLAALKESGFTYRANEKAWTIQADAQTRRLSDELAREFAGQAVGASR
jgi:hypothetical protein